MNMNSANNIALASRISDSSEYPIVIKSYVRNAPRALIILILIIFSFFSVMAASYFYPMSFMLTIILSATGALASVVVTSANRLVRGKLWKPLLTVTEHGIIYHRFSRQILPWSSIQQITLRQVGTNPKIDILFCDDVDPAFLRKVTVGSALLSHVPGRPNITIPVDKVMGATYTEVASLLSQAHRFFARPVVASNNVLHIKDYRVK